MRKEGAVDVWFLREYGPGGLPGLLLKGKRELEIHTWGGGAGSWTPRSSVEVLDHC